MGGACDGMGAELAGMMVTAGASVVLACRDEEPQEGAGSAAEAAAPEPAIL